METRITPAGVKFWLEAIPERCHDCRAREARELLWRDDGEDQPTTLIGKFCKPCAKQRLHREWKATA